MGKFVCIHGHFYQPPRENPWLEMVEVQDSAAPYHDWNQRVTAECYAPNAVARILAPKGAIASIVNNYEHISFNFGPTLMWWLAKHQPDLVKALVWADRASIQRLGHGNAMAQVYNHLIMPLANRRDQRTQIKWGAADFAHYFGRKPQGMWLAETAVDMVSLELMAAEGLDFVVLAPSQARSVRGPDDEQWTDVTGGRVDTGRPYRVSLPGGGSIAAFFYDGELSRAVAFDNLLSDGALFSRRIRHSFKGQGGEDQLVCAATDGESYGHHHRFGEMALAFAMTDMKASPDITVTNFAAYLADHPPRWSAKIVENSSWSCQHGVERWRSDCGCAINPGAGWSQAWRGPLREAFDQLSEGISRQFEELGGGLLKDPWAARDDYITLLLDQSDQARDEFFARHGRGPLDQSQKITTSKLLEAQRWLLYTYTSCAWFFDDISGIEPVQNMRFAARAMQLSEELGAEGLRKRMLATLAKAKSNVKREGDGAGIWRRRVDPHRLDHERVAAHAAISGVLDDQPPPRQIYCYELTSLSHRHQENLGMGYSWGRLKVSHCRLGDETIQDYAALYAGGVDFKAWVSPAEREKADPGEEASEHFKRLDPQGLARHLDQIPGARRFALGDLFLEGRRSLAKRVLSRTTAEQAATVRNIYDANLDLMRFLVSINVPLPPAYSALAGAIIGEELIEGLPADQPGPLPEQLGGLVMEAHALELDLRSPALARAMEQALTDDLAHLAEEPDQDGWAVHGLGILDLARAMELELSLWEAQNLFQRLLIASLKPNSKISELGRRLNFAV